MRHRTKKSERGAHMFPSPPPNQPNQPSWGPGGQGQQVSIQQQHPLLLPQQQQQQQGRPQNQQQQPPWGAVILQGTPSLLIGQQQPLQQQQQQPWGGQHAQQHPAPQLPQQGTQFALSVSQPQSHGVQGQNDHRGASNGQQHQLQGFYPVNPSQSQPPLQAWAAQPSPPQGQPPQYRANHPRPIMPSNSGGGGGGGSNSNSANGVMVLPWGQQLQTSGFSPTTPRVSPASGGSWQGSSRPKLSSSTSRGTSFGKSSDSGSKSNRRDVFAGKRPRVFPPPSPRADGASSKHGRKRKPRAVTETMPANKRTPHPVRDGRASKGRQTVSGKVGGGTSTSAPSGGGGSQGVKLDDGGGIPPCDPCEKEFTSELARRAHLDAHVVCEEPGCGFSALRKVVSFHHEIKHGQFSGSGFQIIDLEGQKFRVLLGTSPREVEQWRAARRKLWPTNANITRKNEETKKRRQLGDPGPDPGQAGRGRGRDRGRGRGRGRDKGGPGRGGGQPVPNLTSADDAQENTDAEENAGVAPKRECGDLGEAPAKMAKLSGSRQGSREKEGNEAGTGVDGLAEAGTGIGARAGLDAGADSEAAVREKSKKLCCSYLRGRCGKGEACAFRHDVKRKPCSYFMNGRCKRGNKCNFMHDPAARAQAKLEGLEAAEDAPSSAVKEKQAGKRVKAEREAMRRSQSKPTLLRKLLAPQLHRESSIALQAVRFIVQSNFFLDPAAARADHDSSHPTSPSSVTAAVDAGASVAGADAGSNQVGESSNKSRRCEEDLKHNVEAGGGQGGASAKAPGAAGTTDAGTASESKETADSADAVACTEGVPPGENQPCRTVGENLIHVKEEDPHSTVESGSSRNGASTEVSSSAATADADIVTECIDTAAASAAAATRTNGLDVGEDISGEAPSSSQSRVKEGNPDQPVQSLSSHGVAATAASDASTDNSSDTISSTGDPVAANTTTGVPLAEDQAVQATSMSQSRVEEENSPRAVEEGSAASVVAPENADAAGFDSETDSCDTGSAAAAATATTSTEEVPSKEDQPGEASGRSQSLVDGHDPHRQLDLGSGQCLTSTVTPEIAAAAGTGSDTETDDTAATSNTNGLPPDENQHGEAAGKSQGIAENEDLQQSIGTGSARSAAGADAAIDSSDISAATPATAASAATAAATTNTLGLPEGEGQSVEAASVSQNRDVKRDPKH